MTGLARDFAHRTAVEVYGAFLDECVMTHVVKDRAGDPPGRTPLERSTAGRCAW